MRPPRKQPPSNAKPKQNTKPAAFERRGLFAWRTAAPMGLSARVSVIMAALAKGVLNSMEKHKLPHDKIIYVCTKKREPGLRVSCGAADGEALRAKLKRMVLERDLWMRVRVSQSGCMDKCEQGPNIMVFPDNVWYSNVQEADLEPLLDQIEADLKAAE